MAGGSFNPLSPPTSPGFYVNFESVATAVVNGGTNGTVLVPFTADWGPVGTFQTVTSAAEYDAIYSSSTNGTGRAAVLGALKGLGSRPGAAQVLTYRMAGTSAATATRILQNAGSTTTFVTLTAKYPGARPANWTVTVQANIIDNTTKDLILYESGVEVERYSGLSASSPAAWATAINSVSSFFTVTAGAATDVANVSGISFNSVSGDSGLTLTGTQWTAFQTAAESQTFNILSPANLTDSTIRSAMVSWAISRNVNGQRFMLVIGGSAGETITDANTRSTGANNENVVNFGYTDLYDLDGNTISTAEFAPRLAGAIADAGVSRSITQQRFSDVTLKVVPTASNIATAYAAGTVMLVSDSVGPRVHQDMTTYTTNSPTKPRREFGKIKAVRTHHQIESDLTNAANNGWLGGDNINVPAYQSVIISGISAYFKRLEDAAVVNTGWSVELDTSEDNTGDSLYLVYGVSTVKAIERIFNTIVLA
jgi:hypothetical protein